MEELRTIYVSSVSREKVEKSESHDFKIKLRSTLSLDRNIKHELAVDTVMMTYSWHNISDKYKNNKIKYSPDNGNTWHTITFPNGLYSYSDINAFIHSYMGEQGHKAGDKYQINLSFFLSTYKALIQIDNNYKLDLRNSSFGDLIGFDEKIIDKTEYGSRLPNITNSIDKINIHCDIVTNSIISGSDDNLLCVIPTDNLTRSYSFKFEPKRLLFNEVSKTNIDEIRFYITDSLSRPIDLNGIDWFMTLIMKSAKIV